MIDHATTLAIRLCRMAEIGDRIGRGVTRQFENVQIACPACRQIVAERNAAKS